MTPVSPGSAAPAIPGATVGTGTVAVLFYKVTCPTCQVVAPVAERLADAADRFVAVAQDPPERIEEFGREFDTSFPSLSEAPPYEVSNAYGIRTVPTVFAVEDGTVVDVAESWDRQGWNRVAATLGLGPVSHEGDGLPPFRPG
ncbi:MAG TPA: hypothetical protein VE754_00185 [Actinomycetota bacterium]|jgi:thiol-disulfide isomerase/thioredoxin|nr:hypothetical protein [Actinomycetota bacterium]